MICRCSASVPTAFGAEPAPLNNIISMSCVVLCALHSAFAAYLCSPNSFPVILWNSHFRFMKTWTFQLKSVGLPTKSSHHWHCYLNTMKWNATESAFPPFSVVISRPCETGKHENMIDFHYHSPGKWNLTFLGILQISHAYEIMHFWAFCPFHMHMKTHNFWGLVHFTCLLK